MKFQLTGLIRQAHRSSYGAFELALSKIPHQHHLRFRSREATLLNENLITPKLLFIDNGMRHCPHFDQVALCGSRTLRNFMLIFLLCASSVAVAQATRQAWVKHGVYEVEINTAMTTKNGVRAWWRSFIEEQNLWVYVLRETDCNEKRFISYKYLVRDRQGVLVHEDSKERIDFVEPGTINHLVMNYHCGFAPDFKPSESFRAELKKRGQ